MAEHKTPMTEPHKHRLDILMFGLLYPAVLGVLLFGYLENVDPDEPFLLFAGLFALLFFASQFVEGQFSGQDSTLPAAARRFFFEILDTVLIYQIAVLLGFAAPLIKKPLPHFLAIPERGFFALILITFLMPIIHRSVSDGSFSDKSVGRDIIASFAIAVSLIGAVTDWCGWLGVLFFLLFFYFLILLKK